MSSVEMSSGFNASIYVSEQLNRQLVNMSQDLAFRCVKLCAEKYNFDAEMAYKELGLSQIKLERSAPMKAKKSNAPKVQAPKASFPLPYNGEFNESCCFALRQNNGLYTQCTGTRKGESHFCKSCASGMQKIGAETPEYGTIQQRMAVGILEYVDPKGRKPTAYTKIMKKHKLTEEQVIAEAGKLNMTINPIHFVATDVDSKRGRPKAEKERKEKGVKGRPKKEKKVLIIEGDDEDLFETLVNQANDETEADKKKSKTDEKKKKAEEEEKAAKKAAAEKAKAEKEAKLAAEKAEKEAKKEAERLEREAKKKAEEEEKAAKKAAAEKAKAEKEAKLAAEKAAKEAAKASKGSKPKKDEPEEEAGKVYAIKYEGKKYLKSNETGIIYDYDKLTQEQEQVVVGKWNAETKKIDFNEEEEEEEDDEEEEEMYDM